MSERSSSRRCPEGRIHRRGEGIPREDDGITLDGRKKDYREPVGQLYSGPVYHVPFGDAEAVERQLEICETIGVGIAAVMMEPIQGEAGAIVPPDDFWPRIRAASTRNTEYC